MKTELVPREKPRAAPNAHAVMDALDGSLLSLLPCVRTGSLARLLCLVQNRSCQTLHQKRTAIYQESSFT